MSPAEMAELVAKSEEHGLAYDQDENEETHIQVIQPGGLAAIAKSEIESQLDAAHKYPRKISTFLAEAGAMVCRTQEIASMCFYALPRDGKTISGPSVRLAEIAASAYGNLHVGARPIDVSENEVTSQGVAWDLQKNLRVTVEKKRRITTKNGKRFGEDMIIVTQNAASSIALRDAIFRVIPRAYIQELYDLARKTAVGDAKTIKERREKMMLHFAKLGIGPERVLAAVAKPEVESITLEDLEKLIGFATAIKEGQATIEQCFPEAKPSEAAPSPTEAEEGRRMKLGGDKTPKPRVQVEMPPEEPGSNG